MSFKLIIPVKMINKPSDGMDNWKPDIKLTFMDKGASPMSNNVRVEKWFKKSPKIATPAIPSNTSVWLVTSKTVKIRANTSVQAIRK